MKNLKNVLLLKITLLILGLQVFAFAAPGNPDNVTILVPKNHVFHYIGGAVGGYFYSPTDDRFYTYTFGSGQGMRCFTGPTATVPEWVLPGSAWRTSHPEAEYYYLSDEYGNSWQCTSTSDMYRITLSRDIEAGLFNSYDAGTSAPMFDGSVINPTPVTFNGIYYPAGKLAVIANYNKGPTVAATKAFLTWDLREIWSPTNVAPDNNNAQYDGGAPSQKLEIERFGQQYGYGCTNWNDTFRLLVSLQDAADAIGASVPLPITTPQISSRRGVFAPDATKVYFVSKETATPKRFTGVWSVRMSDKKVRQIFNDTASSIITTSEPGSIKVGLRNFSGLPYDPNLNQVLFNGTTASGNIGGINALVDIDTNSCPVYVAVDANQLLEFIEAPEPNVAKRPMVWDITTDSAGNIYFDIRGGTGVEGLFKYDTKGRLICVVGRPTLYASVYYTGITPGNVSANRLDLRMVENPYIPGQQIPQLMWANTSITAVSGAYVFKPCDFNRDGDINVADMDFFKAQLKKSSDTIPVIDDGNDFVDYLKADLNGNGIVNAEKTGITAACVTAKDAEVLYQFVKPGDTNFDSKVDFVDFANLARHFNDDAEIKNWAQGDFDFDDVTDINDIRLLGENWLETYEL